MVKLHQENDAIIEEIYQRKNDAEIARQREYVAAVQIQAFFRGCRVRSYMRHLHNSAKILQKRWRGFLGRQFYRILVKNSVLIMKLNFYNGMATKVQKVWRGYYVRKYVFNYYSRKRYLEALQIKNELVRSELEEFSEQQEHVRQRQREMEHKKRREHMARKHHFLISTHVIPGIYNSPFLPYPTETEYLLRSVKPHPPKVKKKTEDNQYDPSWKSYDTTPPKQLPPLTRKPQGPFRTPEDVQKQRYKPFEPTLRVATSFWSLEDARQDMKAKEWTTRVIDDKFIPFSRREHKYDPLLHTSSSYGHLPYGSKYYREEFIDKHVTLEPFKTAVPPIPVFEKLNNTFSQGQV
ncbi:hypothetical protein ScPMuIL_013960 [Solemya velum]